MGRLGTFKFVPAYPGSLKSRCGETGAFTFHPGVNCAGRASVRFTREPQQVSATEGGSKLPLSNSLALLVTASIRRSPSALGR